MVAHALTSALALLLTACGGASSVAGRLTSGTPTTAPSAPSPAPVPAAAPVTTASTLPATTTSAPAPKPPPPPGLVDVQDLEPSIVVALNKLTSANFTGEPLPGYEANRAFLAPAGAQALADVQRRLAPLGLGLKIYDAYRPARATRAMVAAARAQGRGHLVGPYIASVSYHNSGQAVDLTLVERASGEELDMGTAYETFTPAAHTGNATGVAAENRRILVDAMHAEGFVNYEGEWWHFNYFTSGAYVRDDPVR